MDNSPSHSTQSRNQQGLSTEQAQRLSHIAEDIRDQLKDLTDHYRDFVRVIKAENAHLKLNGPFDLEDIIRQKTAIGQSLELAVIELYHGRQKLRSFCDRVHKDSAANQAAAQDGFTLTLLYQQLESAAAGHPDLTDILHDTRTALDVLLRVQKESDRWVKLNAFVIEKMLEQHTQVIDLWQSVITTSEGTYNKKGTKLTGRAGGKSAAVLRTKA